MKKIITALVLLPLLISACSPAAQPSASTEPPAAATQITLPTITRAAKPTAARPSTRTPAPRPTATSTAAPARWLAAAQVLPDWPGDVQNGIWMDASRLRVETGMDGRSVVEVDLSRRPPAASPVTLPAVLLAVEPMQVTYSPRRTFAVVCEPSTVGDQPGTTLRLYHAADGTQVSEAAAGQVEMCDWAIGWAPDESALSFVGKKADGGTFPFLYDIFVWKTDGSAPVRIGEGTFPDDPGRWSPDGSRLVVEFLNDKVSDPAYERNIQILYPDGRPAQRHMAQLGSRMMNGLEWLTGAVLTEQNSCCVTCSFYDYYLASTGQHLEAISWHSCGIAEVPAAQDPHLSEDQRWFVVDTTRFNFIAQVPSPFIYTLYDFQTRQSYSLSETEDIVLDFVGWSGGAFYLIRRPVNGEITEMPGAPFGLLALDPRTRQMRLVQPEIRFGWLSSDGSHILGAVPAGDEAQVALYELDGTAVTEPVTVALPEAIPMTSLPRLDSIYTLPEQAEFIDYAWSPDGTRVAAASGRALWLLGMDGTVEKLAETLPDPDDRIYIYNQPGAWNTQVFFWSPDGASLVVLTGPTAWVLNMR